MQFDDGPKITYSTIIGFFRFLISNLNFQISNLVICRPSRGSGVRFLPNLPKSPSFARFRPFLCGSVAPVPAIRFASSQSLNPPRRPAHDPCPPLSPIIPNRGIKPELFRRIVIIHKYVFVSRGGNTLQLGLTRQAVVLECGDLSPLSACRSQAARALGFANPYVSLAPARKWKDRRHDCLQLRRAAPRIAEPNQTANRFNPKAQGSQKAQSPG